MSGSISLHENMLNNHIDRWNNLFSLKKNPQVCTKKCRLYTVYGRSFYLINKTANIFTGISRSNFVIFIDFIEPVFSLNQGKFNYWIKLTILRIFKMTY